MRMHGSIFPKMILPLLAVAAWATAISVIHFYRTKRKRKGLSGRMLLEGGNLARY